MLLPPLLPSPPSLPYASPPSPPLALGVRGITMVWQNTTKHDNAHTPLHTALCVFYTGENHPRLLDPPWHLYRDSSGGGGSRSHRRRQASRVRAFLPPLHPGRNIVPPLAGVFCRGEGVGAGLATRYSPRSTVCDAPAAARPCPCEKYRR